MRGGGKEEMKLDKRSYSHSPLYEEQNGKFLPTMSIHDPFTP